MLMMWPRNVNLSTTAAARRGSVKVFPHSTEVPTGSQAAFRSVS